MTKSHFDGGLPSVTVSKILYFQMYTSMKCKYYWLLPEVAQITIKMTEHYFFVFLNKVKL